MSSESLQPAFHDSGSTMRPGLTEAQAKALTERIGEMLRAETHDPWTGEPKVDPKLARLREDFERLERWASEQNAGNAFATQVAYYARARLAEWDLPLEEWEP